MGPQTPYTSRPDTRETLCRVSVLANISCVHSGTPIFSNRGTFHGRGGDTATIAMHAEGATPNTYMSAPQGCVDIEAYMQKAFCGLSLPSTALTGTQLSQRKVVYAWGPQLRSLFLLSDATTPGLAGTQRVTQALPTRRACSSWSVARSHLPGKVPHCASKRVPRVRRARAPVQIPSQGAKLSGEKKRSANRFE